MAGRIGKSPGKAQACIHGKFRFCHDCHAVAATDDRFLLLNRVNSAERFSFRICYFTKGNHGPGLSLPCLYSTKLHPPEQKTERGY